MSERAIDITTAERKLILALLGKYLPSTSTWAYGSRVTWKARPQSDLDMVVFATPEQAHAVANLKEAFEESDLPFRVDLFAWHEVPEQFQKNIMAEHVVLVERQEKGVPDGWKQYKLSEVINLIGGGTPKRSVPEYWGGSIPWLSVKDFNSNVRYVYSAQEHITDIGLSKSNTRMLNKGQIIISACGTVGALAQLSQPMAFNQSCYGIDAKCEFTENDFLYYIIKHSIEKFKQLTHGAVFDTITLNTFDYIGIELPSLPEQRTIAHILGSFDDKISLNRRMNATLEGMAQALFQSWFVDFDPVIDKALAAGNPIPEHLQACAAVRESLGDARNSLPEDIQALFPDAFEDTEEMGWIPKGWGGQPLYDIANFINGAAYRNFHFTDEVGALPIVKIAEIKNGISGQTKFTKTVLAEKYRIADGDILFSWSGNPDTSIDTFVWTGGPGWLNQHIFKVDLYSPEDRNFVYYQLKFLRPAFAEIARNKQTTGLGHVTAQDMKRLFVIKCGKKMLEAFNHCIEHLFDKWYINLLETKRLADIRDTFLPKLLSGEVRVANVENFLKGSSS